MRIRTALLAGIAAVVTTALAVQAQVPGVNSTLNSVFTLAYDNSTMKQTFSSSVAFGPAGASATDVCMINGSATKTLKVRRVFFSAIATTAITEAIAVVKRSTANTGGTTFTNLPIAYDSRNTASTAALKYYTANPTTGTLVGVIADPLISIGNLTTGGAQAFPSAILFGQLGQPIVLRGVAEGLAVNFGSQSFPAIYVSCGFEWTEDNDS